jgi:hypothetical protein
MEEMEDPEAWDSLIVDDDVEGDDTRGDSA